MRHNTSNRYSVAVVGIVAVGVVVIVAIVTVWHRTAVVVGGDNDGMMIVGDSNHTHTAHTLS